MLHPTTRVWPLSPTRPEAYRTIYACSRGQVSFPSVRIQPSVEWPSGMAERQNCGMGNSGQELACHDLHVCSTQ